MSGPTSKSRLPQIAALVGAQFWCTLLSLGLTFVVCQVFFQGRKALWIPVFLVASVLYSGTWGSWSSLVWNSSGPARLVARIVTFVPGLLLTVAGIAMTFANPVLYQVGIACALSGAGTVVCALLIHRNFVAVPPFSRATSFSFSALLFPLVTAVCSIAVGAAWFHFVRHPPGGDWRALLSLRSLITCLTAISLCTTIIPGATADLARRFGRLWTLRNGGQ